ncbi:MAG: hypothetical protein ABWZ56_08335 [Flavobacterium sp.]
MKQTLLKYKYHFLLVIIALIWINIFDFLTQIASQGLIYPDSKSYLVSAKNLYVFYRGHNYRPVLMAIINGFPYLFGFSDTAIYSFSFFVNLVCWLTFFVVLFEIFKEFLQPKKAFVLSIIPVFFIGNSTFVFHLLTENIYMLFIVFGFYFLVKYYKTKAFLYLSIALSIFILCMLIKPGAKFLAIVFLLFFIKEIIRNYKSKFTLIIYGSVLMVLVQCAGIKHQFGNFTISYIDAVTYYNYLGSRAEFIKTGKEYEQINNPRNEYIYNLECKDQKKIAFKDLKNQLQFNTINLVKAYISDVVENSITGNIYVKDSKNIKNKSFFDVSKTILFAISEWQNRFFSFFGFVLGIFYFFKSYKNEKQYSCIAFFILYTIVLSGMSYDQGDRFHAVTFPFTLLLAVKFITEKTTFLKKTKRFSALLQK